MRLLVLLTALVLPTGCSYFHREWGQPLVGSKAGALTEGLTRAEQVARVLNAGYMEPEPFERMLYVRCAFH